MTTRSSVSRRFTTTAPPPRRGRRDRRGRAGRAFYAQETRPRFSDPGHRILPRTGRQVRARSRLRRVLRKAVPKFERLLETYFAFAPLGFQSFRMAMPVWLKEKIHLPHVFARAWGTRRRRRSSSPITTRATPPARSSPALRRGRDPHARRRRRMEHDHLRRRARQRIDLTQQLAVSRTRSACCIRRSRTTAASRSTAASTS